MLMKTGRILWLASCLSLLACAPIRGEETPAAATPATTLEFSSEASSRFTPLEIFSASELRESQRVLSGWEAATGALAEPSGSGYARLHEPWKKEAGRLALEYTADVRKASEGTQLYMRLVKQSDGGDGVGIAVYADMGEKVQLLGRCVIPAKGGAYECALNLTPIYGKLLQVFIVVDSNNNTFADSIALENPHIMRKDGKILPFLRKRSAILPESKLMELELKKKRPEASILMTPHLSGRQKGVNVYSARDSRRPMIGAHVYFAENARKRLNCLKDVFDYITHDAKEMGDRLCELAGIPWVSIYHNPIPVNAYDKERIAKIKRNGEIIGETATKYAFRLGSTSGSEPHFSPDYYYTGHKKDEIENLITSAGGAKQFGEWLHALYGDDTPDADTNGDGITFAKDFGFSTPDWRTLSHAVKKSGKDYKFLFTLFKEHILYEDIKYIDSAYTASGCVITSRLLSPQYEATFGQSLRQLRLPEFATAVTYYTTSSNALDPSATQMRFQPSRLYTSEKTYRNAFELRPPFWQSSGRCYGIFGPFPQAEKLSFELKTSFTVKAELLFAIHRIDADGKSTEVFSQRLNGNFSGAYEVALNHGDQCKYEISMRSLTPDTMNNNVKAILVNPMIHTNGNAISLHEWYADSQIGYVLDSAPQKRVVMGKSDNRYSPEITEFRGSYIYSQALRNGLRPLYNEFMSGNHISNTASNVWRSIFHELQFQPAGIVWFCYGGGSPGSSFSDMDCHYLATELAVLRGQLELLNVYRDIKRDKRDIALFIPTAAPSPLTGMRDAEQRIGSQLTPFSPDVFLADQQDKVKEYDNIVLYAAFMDGASDRYWNEFLKAIPTDKKVIVIMNDVIYTEPGQNRESADFRHSLAAALPIYPRAKAAQNSTIEVNAIPLQGKWHPASIAPSRNANDHAVIRLNAQPVAFASDNLIVLSGIPEAGLEKIASKFFNIKINATRDAGALHILNRDAVIDKPGIYCMDENQTLQIPAKRPAFDLTRRQVVTGSCSQATVIVSPAPDKLQLIDCGTARALVKSENAESAEVDLQLPEYPFEGDAKPELIFFAPKQPTVSCDGKQIDASSLGNGFWRSPVAQSGIYRVEL